MIVWGVVWMIVILLIAVSYVIYLVLNFDRNLWSLSLIENRSQNPLGVCSFRSLRSLRFAVLCCVPLCKPAARGSERVARALLTENNSQQAKPSVCRLTYCLLHVDIVGGVCHTICIPNGGDALRLKDTTFILGDKPMRTLLWCNTQKRAKRNKPSKINGVQHHEISDSVEHTYYQPV